MPDKARDLVGEAHQLAGLLDETGAPKNYAAEDKDLRALLKQFDLIPDVRPELAAALGLAPIFGPPGEALAGEGETEVEITTVGAGMVEVNRNGRRVYRENPVAPGTVYQLKFTPSGVTPPPPPPPPTTLTITGLTAGSPVVVGSSVPVTVTLSGPALAITTVSLVSSAPNIVSGAPTLVVPVGAASAQASCQALAAGSARITASLGQSSRAVEVTVTSVPPPPPPPGPVKNVRDFGAVGDGRTDDYRAVQAAMHAFGVTTPGSGPHKVYLPAGRYFFSRKLQIMGQHDIHVVGDGPMASWIVAPGIDGVQIGRQENCAVMKLGIEGKPGVYHKDGSNDGHGVTLEGAINAKLEDLLIRGQGMAVAAFAGAVGAEITRVNAAGWATVGFFFGAGWRVRDCNLIQDDPNLTAQRSGHGIYIPSAASDIIINNLRIENARIYGGQLYGEVQGSVQRDILIDRLVMLNCNNGFTTARETGAAELLNFTLQNFEIGGIYNGHAFHMKKGSNSVIQDGKMGPVGGEGAGLWVGGWAPYEPNQSIDNLVIRRVAIEECQKGAWFYQSNGGHLTKVRLENATMVKNNRQFNVGLEPWMGQMPDDVVVMP